MACGMPEGTPGCRQAGSRHGSKRQLATRRLAGWLALGVLWGAGCGPPTYKLAPVSGRVTLNGNPLEGAYVSFQPRGERGNDFPGPASSGKTDADGRFVLAPVGSPQPGREIGALVGRHRVLIRKGQTAAQTGDQSGQYHETLPERYNSESVLEITVPAGGTDKADFRLTSSPEEAGGAEKKG